MKKILIGVLIVLLVILAYFAIFRGISIGSLQILSVKQIEEENNKLTEEIAQTETLMHSSYRAQTDQLEQSVSGMLLAKDEYLELASISTEGELNEANKEESYKIEYLWTRIGSHATGEGVILKLDVKAGDTGESDVKNLAFTVTGNYIAVINFVSSVEDDSKLGFRIEEFKILPGEGENNRQATFNVRNVRIQQENTTRNVTSTTESTNTTPDNTSSNSAGETNTTNQTDNTNMAGEANSNNVVNETVNQ